MWNVVCSRRDIEEGEYLAGPADCELIPDDELVADGFTNMMQAFDFCEELDRIIDADYEIRGFRVCG